MDIPDGLPDRRRPAELPSRGLSGTSGDEEVNAGTFSTLACPGYCGNFGRGKLPSPTVTQMRYAGPLACSERKAPYHRPVRHEGRSEEKADSKGGTAGELREGHLGLWQFFGECDFIQLSGEGNDGGR